MSESVIAACQDCGKKYRVPSADRTYPCKACGGVVSAVGSPARSPERAERRRSDDAEDDHEGERERRPRGARRKQSSSLPIYLGTAAGVAAIGAGVWFAFGSGEASAAVDRDLTKVTEYFDQAWGAGKLDDLLSMAHPDKKLDLEVVIEGAKEHRGWTDGFAPITSTEVPTAGLNPGDMAQVNKNGTSLETGIGVHSTAEGKLISRWQYSNARERWLFYELEIPPPELGPRLAEFQAAWNTGDQAKIRPFLRQEKVDDLLGAFAKIADRDGWEEQFPPITPASTDPANLEELSNLGFSVTYPTKAKALYDTKYGVMSTSWRLDRVSDDWFLRSFKPPK